MRPLPSLVLAASLVSAAPACAEDFTGFYAGVNAGYAISREAGRQAGAVASVPSAPAAESGLPPSALSAAERLEEKRPTTRRSGAR